MAWPAEEATAPDVALLERVLWRQLLKEAPGANRNRAWQRRIKRLAVIVQETGIQGTLVSPWSDPFILAGIAWHECRFRLDCDTGNGNFGPMQLNNGTPRWLPNIDPKWRGYRKKQLLDPALNVSAAYEILAHHKTVCGGKLVNWLAAYRSGRCSRPDDNARMRLDTIRALTSYAESLPVIESAPMAFLTSACDMRSRFAASSMFPRASTTAPLIRSVFLGGPALTAWPFDRACFSMASQSESLSIQR